MIAKITADMVTDEQIKQLQYEANEHGDNEQADLCRLALGITTLMAWNITPYGARIRCAAAIQSASDQFHPPFIGRIDPH